MCSDRQVELITVIIVNWNGGKCIRECLHCLDNQSFKQFSVILVDNGLTDESVDIVRKNFGSVRIIALDENSGFARGNNMALKGIFTKYGNYSAKKSKKVKKRLDRVFKQKVKMHSMLECLAYSWQQSSQERNIKDLQGKQSNPVRQQS